MTCSICNTNHREPQDHPYTTAELQLRLDEMRERAAHLAEITIHLSMGAATAEEVCEHLAAQRKLIADRIRAMRGAAEC